MAVASTYGYSGSPVFITVGTTGTYNITAYGAQGGSGQNSGGGIVTGGLGAEEGGTFTLTAGEHLEIVVGGRGFQPVVTPMAAVAVAGPSCWQTSG